MTYTAMVVKGNLVVYKGNEYVLEVDANPRRGLACCLCRLEVGEIEGLIELASKAAEHVGIDPVQLSSLRKKEVPTLIATARLREGLPLDATQQELVLRAMVEQFIAAGDTASEAQYGRACMLRDNFEKAGYLETPHGGDTPHTAQRYALKCLGKAAH